MAGKPGDRAGVGVQAFRRSGVQGRQGRRPARFRRPERLNARTPERLTGERSVKPIQRWSEGRTWSCAAGLLCAVAAGLLSRTPFLERWELRTQDYRFERRGPRKTGAKIVIGAMSDSTLEKWQEPMASWGAHYAAAITKARGLGAS